MLGLLNVLHLCIDLGVSMTLIIPFGYGSATVNMALSGKADPLAFTFGFINSGALTAAACATQLDANLRTTNSLMRAGEILTGYSYTGVDVTINTLAGTFTGSAGTLVTGTLSGDPMPPNCALLVSKQTATGGRIGKGRMFLPPAFYGESGFDANGNFIGAGQARIQADLDTFRSQCTSTGVGLHLLHSNAGDPPDPITALVLNSRIATQRRRLR